MTVNTSFQNLGLSVQIYKPNINPIAGTYEPYADMFSDDATEHIEEYSHEITSERGFFDTTITLRLHSSEAEKWFETILGFSILVTDQAYNVVFEGFINKINLTYGTFTAVRGPLLDIANRVIVEYTPVDFQITPPIEGITLETVAAEDSASQKRYGILETILAGGKLGVFGPDETDNDAYKIRNTYLAENKDAQTSDKSIMLGESGEFISITLDCYGFVKFLEAYVYNYLTLHTVTIGTKIKDIIDNDPNGLIHWNEKSFQDNLYLTSSSEESNKRAFAIIKGLLVYGDDYTDYRRTFGVYEDRMVHYATMPTDITYFHDIRSDEPFVVDANQVSISPWLVRPAKWLHISGMLNAMTADTVRLRDDPRNVFIESVSYSAPFGLDINGMKLSTIPQMLMKYGLGGLST